MHNRTYGKFIKLICLLCAISLFPLLTACNKNTDEEQTSGEVYYTISFNTNGGSAVESLKVLENQYATRPEDPTLDNYVFRRWEYEGREWDFETKRVTENVTVSALWVSAIELFSLEPDESNEGLMITGFKKQASFSTLRIPSVINGKKIVGIADEAMQGMHTEHAQTIIIPETITYIGDNAFEGATGVSIVFEGPVNRIGEASFDSCEMLKEIKLGTGIDKIPFMAFSGCSALKTVNIPEGVSIIDENSFEDCTSMKTVVFPTTLTSIEDSAFLGCSAIVSIFFAGSEDQFDAIEIADGNDALLDAKVYFYSETEPVDDGEYWHYEKGNPVIW
ncbi:MAG: leucine-rich repeat protein [Clostridia bacterium]|nr:leucine-rich repeat protein [Clostridia bacterium]